MWLWECQISGPLFWQVSLEMNSREAWHDLTAFWQDSVSFVQFLSKLASESPLMEFQVRAIWGSHVSLHYSPPASKGNMGSLSALCRHAVRLASSFIKQRKWIYFTKFQKEGGGIFISIPHGTIRLLEYKSIFSRNQLLNLNHALKSKDLHVKNGHENNIYLLDLLCGWNEKTHAKFVACCLVPGQAQ